MLCGENGHHKFIFLLGTLLFLLFCTKEIGNFYQTGHEGFVNAEVGLSHLNTINNGFLKTKFGATNYEVIIDRAPKEEEYYTRYPYLHNFLLALLWKVTGPSEVAARLFMTVLLLLALLTFYIIFRELGYSQSQATLMYLTLCSFPVFFHYSGFSNGEISCLFPLALSYLFYQKLTKTGRSKHLLFFLVSLTFCCQLFWFGYIAAFFFFLDSLIAFFSRRERKSMKTAVALVLAVGFNIAVYILHTLWLVGTLNDVIYAFFWRTSLQAPAHQKFTMLEFINKNLTRWWLFNPVVIFLAALGLVAFITKRNADVFHRIRKRMVFLLLFPPLFFSFLLSHLVYWHDFLVIYFAFFLGMAATDFFLTQTEKMPVRQKKLSLHAYIFFLLFFAIFGLIHQPEEKKIDLDTDNYDLYYTLKTLKNITPEQDQFLFSIDRLQEPQVRFYLRRVSTFLKFEGHAKAYIDSGVYSYFVVENKPRFGSLIKFLLQHYRCHKYDRYFVFDLGRPSPSLRIFRREKKKTGLFYKYFVSPHHQPGSFIDVSSQRAAEAVTVRYEQFPDLYQ